MNILFVKVFSQDHKFFPPKKFMEDLQKCIIENNRYNVLVIPDHTDIRINEKDKIIIVTVGSKKLKWVPTEDWCIKIKKLLKSQIKRYSEIKNFDIDVIPITLKNKENK